MRWLLRSLLAMGALCALVLVFVTALLWVLGSEQGAAWIVGRLTQRTNGAINVGRVEGTLLGGIGLTNVAIRLARDEVDIPTLTFSWAVAASLSGDLVLDDVRAGAVQYRRLPPRGPARPPGSYRLDLPLAIAVRRATLASLTLNAANESLVFGETRAAAARFADSRLTLQDLVTESSGVQLTGDGEVRLGEAIYLGADIEWLQPALEQPLGGRLTLTGDLPVLRVHHEFAPPLAIVADGVLTTMSPPRVDLTIEWRDFAVPGVSDVRSDSGRLVLSGSVDGYTFDSAGEVMALGNAGTFAINGSGQAGVLMVDTVTLDSARGRVTANGEVAFDVLELDLTVGIESLDPSWLVPDWPGRLTGTGRVTAALTPLTWSVGALDVSGELRGLPLAATGAVDFAADELYRLSSVELKSGASRVTLDGAFGAAGGQPLELSVGADIAALQVLWPALEGALVADLELSGSWAAPRASGRAEARDLVLGVYSAERISVAGRAGLDAEAPLDLVVEADALARGTVQAGGLRAALEGRTRAHRVTVDGAGERWQSSIAAAGGLTPERSWRGTIETLEIDEEALGTWRLTDPAPVAIGRGNVRLATSCLDHESGGRWCAELSIEGSPEDRLVVSAQNFELESLQPLLPPQIQLEGVYQLSASFADLSGEPRGSLAVSGGSTQVSIALSETETFATVLEDLIVGATLAEGELDLSASVMSRETGRLNLTTRIDDVGAEDSPITGRLNLLWPDLSFLSVMMPEIGQVGGVLTADLAVAGTVNEPQLQGSARWSEGQIAVPQWGLLVERIQADAESGDGTELEFRASGWVGDGELKLEGTTELDPRAGWPTDFTLRGDSIRALQLPEAEVFVSPDLVVKAELPDINVTGTVHIPRARIEISQLPEAAVAPSPDAVVHGGDTTREVRGLTLTSDILLTLGDEVEYLGLNLMTKVMGELRVRMDANRTAAATGSLVLTGTYNAYGKILELERGQLLFNGPLDEPALDVRAVRMIEGDTRRVGVELVGTVKAPRTRVFSEPPETEADALSYLLFDRPMTSSGGEDTGTLQTAALAMGLQQALPAVQRIGQSLGLDEFTVQSTSTDAGAFMAGKYLSPKVFIRYSYGLFNRIGGLLLRFRVNERFSIETRSGDQQSMDLLYTVEKD